MAVANTKSTQISNAEATPRVINDTFTTRGDVFCSAATVEVAAADDDASVYRMVRLPSNALIVSILHGNDAITAGTDYDFGGYDTADNGGAVISKNGLVDALDMSSARAVLTEVLFGGATGVNVDKINKRLWEVLGLSTDPKKDIDLCWTANTVGSAAGTLSSRVFWTF